MGDGTLVIPYKMEDLSWYVILPASVTTHVPLQIAMIWLFWEQSQPGFKRSSPWQKHTCRWGSEKVLLAAKSFGHAHIMAPLELMRSQSCTQVLINFTRVKSNQNTLLALTRRAVVCVGKVKAKQLLQKAVQRGRRCRRCAEHRPSCPSQKPPGTPKKKTHHHLPLKLLKHKKSGWV